MNCPNCGKPLQEGAKFCMGCGQRIPRCPTCGTVLLKRAKFCMVDGTRIPDEINALIPELVQEPVAQEEPKAETVIPEPVAEKPVEKPPVQKKAPVVAVPDPAPVKKVVKEQPKQKPAEPKAPAYDEQKPVEMPIKKKTQAIVPIIAVIAAIALLAGGFFAGKALFGGKEEPTAQQEMTEEPTEQDETESATDATEPVETIPETEATETEPPKILMPNCIGLTHEEAVLAFEAIPCQLSFDLVYSDTVAANYVIEQNLPVDCELTSETQVVITVSKGPDVAPEGYNQKVTVTAGSGSSYGTLTLYDWENGQWVSKFMCDATLGSNGISPDYGEGRKRTPEGVYKLGVALTANELSDSGWPAHLVTSDTCVVDDVNSPLYNTIQSIQGLGSGVSYDPIGRTITQGTCNVCIYIEHNGNGYSSDNVVAGNGSVITICGRNPAIKPTFGCIDISATNMNNLLSMLSYEKNPHIEIYTE